MTTFAGQLIHDLVGVGIGGAVVLLLCLWDGWRRGEL